MAIKPEPTLSALVDFAENNWADFLDHCERLFPDLMEESPDFEAEIVESIDWLKQATK